MRTKCVHLEHDSNKKYFNKKVKNDKKQPKSSENYKSTASRR